MGVKVAIGRQCLTKEIEAPQAEEPPAFEALVRKLVAYAKQAGPVPAGPPPSSGEDGAASGEVLFACEVDGVRCVLAWTHDAPVDDRSLSPREQEIARMVAKGHPNKIIASVLEISVWTVSTHLRRTYAKLGVTSRAAMVAWMFKHGKL